MDTLPPQQISPNLPPIDHWDESLHSTRKSKRKGVPKKSPSSKNLSLDPGVIFKFPAFNDRSIPSPQQHPLTVNISPIPSPHQIAQETTTAPTTISPTGVQNQIPDTQQQPPSPNRSSESAAGSQSDDQSEYLPSPPSNQYLQSPSSTLNPADGTNKSQHKIPSPTQQESADALKRCEILHYPATLPDYISKHRRYSQTYMVDSQYYNYHFQPQSLYTHPHGTHNHPLPIPFDFSHPQAPHHQHHQNVTGLGLLTPPVKPISGGQITSVFGSPKGNTKSRNGNGYSNRRNSSSSLGSGSGSTNGNSHKESNGNEGGSNSGTSRMLIRNGVPVKKECICCGSTKSAQQTWRTGWEDHIVLCNQCGLRFKNTKMHCHNCNYIPTKSEAQNPNLMCKRCGDPMRR